MTQEQKYLVLKDLCARLPYGVKIAMPGLWDSKITIEPLNEIFKGDDGLFRANGNGHCIEYIKPYLFPISSMTDEQIYQSPFGYATMDTIRQDDSWSTITIGCREYDDIIDWLNKNHFDYRGLIPMGLALDATGLNIY